MHGEEHVGQGFVVAAALGNCWEENQPGQQLFPSLGLSGLRPIFCVLFASTSEASVSACVCVSSAPSARWEMDTHAHVRRTKTKGGAPRSDLMRVIRRPSTCLPFYAVLLPARLLR
jgi:hypothetical protein